MQCKELIKFKVVNNELVNDSGDVESISRFFTNAINKRWNNIKSNDIRSQLLNLSSRKMYLPELGKVLSLEDKDHLTVIQSIIDNLAKKGALENILGEDLKALKLFYSPDVTNLDDTVQEEQLLVPVSQLISTLIAATLDELLTTNKELISLVYANHKGYNNKRRFLLQREIIRAVFANEDFRLNKNEWQINSNFAKLKNLWMHTICLYLGKKEMDYYDPTMTSYKYNKNVEDIIKSFRHSLYTREFRTTINTNSNFREAVDAFFNLVNFDEELKDFMPDIRAIRNPDRTFNDRTAPYIIKASSTLRKSWSDNELINGLTNISKLAKNLFMMIPYINKNGKEVLQFITDIEAISTVSDLIKEVSSTRNGYLTELKQKVLLLRANSKDVLNEVFNDPHIQSIITSRFNEKLLDILRSIKLFAFSEDGLYGKELRGSNSDGPTILDILTTAIVSMDPMNYQASTIEDKGNRVESYTLVRDKFNYNREALDLAETINKLAKEVTDLSDSMVMYDVRSRTKIPYPSFKGTSSDNTFWINSYGGLVFSVQPNLRKANTQGVLSNNPSNIIVRIYLKSPNGIVDITDKFKDFNNAAISEGKIRDEYREAFSFIEDSLGLRTMSQNELYDIYSIMQQNFGEGETNGFMGMLYSALQNEIVKHLKGYYQEYVHSHNDAASELSIANFYDSSVNGTLNSQYMRLNFKSPTGAIVRPGEAGVEYRIINLHMNKWAEKFGMAKKMIEGTNIAAVTSNSSGDKIPNFRQYSIGNNLNELLREQVNSELDAYKSLKTRTLATSSLLLVDNFARHTNLFSLAVLDLEAVDSFKNPKKVKAMNSAELMYHGMFDNFYAHLFDKDNPYIGSKMATYADKTSEWLYYLHANINIDDSKMAINQLTSPIVKLLYRLSIGQFYRRSFNNTLYDLISAIDGRMFPEFPLKIADNIGYDELGIYHVGYNMTEDLLLEAAKIFDTWCKEVPTNNVEIFNGQRINTKDLYKKWKSNPNQEYLVIDDLSYTAAEIYSGIEKGITEELLMRSNNNNKELYSNISYIKYKGKIRLNPEAVFLATLQFKEDTFDRRWQLEKIGYINDLLKELFKVRLTQTIDNTGGQEELADIIPPTIKTLPANKSFMNFFNSESLKSWRLNGETEWRADDWRSGDYMILAKIKSADGNYYNVMFDSELSLSPGDELILNPMIDYYFNVDTLMSNNLRLNVLGTELADPLKYKNFSVMHLRALSNLTQQINNGNLALLPIRASLSLVRDLDDVIQNMELLAQHNLPLFLELEGHLWNTSNKRANMVSATMMPFLLGTQQGVTYNVNAATIQDLGAPVWNFKGIKDDPIKSMDGATFIHPLQAVWESWSLGGQTIGMDKKTIGHAYNNRTGSAVLWKHATYAITNERMRMSSNSEVNLESMFRRMSQMSFDENVQLTNLNGITFDNLYYESGPNLFSRIRKLIYLKDLKVYVTLESDMYLDLDGNWVEDTDSMHYVAQVFNAKTGERLSEEEANRQSEAKEYSTETINNIYELHKALGGIYTKELIDGQLVDSEGSNIEAARVINSTDTPTRNYLKTRMIHYLANESSSKRAQGNITSRKAWTDSSIPINYVSMTLLHYGVLLDADHDAEDGEITLPTLVMTALEQGGYLHHMAKRVYFELGQLALDTCKLEINTAQLFLDAYNKGEKLPPKVIDLICETVGSLVALSYSQLSDAELGDIILSGMAKVLKTDSEELKLNFKLPLSDASLFSSLLPSIATVINNKAIKGKYSGLALVMTPGYKYVQTFKYGGEPRMVEDVYQDAVREMNAATFNPENFLAMPLSYDYQIRKKLIVLAYLLYQLNIEEGLHPNGIDPEEFIPGDIVNIMYEQRGKKYRAHLNLDNIDTYYEFEEACAEGTIGRYLEEKGLVINGENIRFCQDVMHPRDLMPERISFKYRDAEGIEHKSNIFLVDGIRYNRNNKEMRKEAYQQILNDLHNGYAVIHRQRVKIYDVDVLAAENVMPNIYGNKFGTLHMTLLLARNHIMNSLGNVKNPNIFKSNYDIAFTSANLKHTYISFTSPKTDNDLGIKYKLVDFANRTAVVNEDGIDWIYRIDRDRLLLYKVGIKLEGLEPFYFINEYNVSHPNGNLRDLKFKYYYINKESLKALGISDELIASIVRDIYSQDFYLGAEISLSETKNQTNSNIINNIFNDDDLLQFIDNLYSLVGPVLEDSRREYYTRQLKYLISSFDKSLDALSDRIPTASLQSFMKMRTVGFTLINNNRIYVSHFLAWLLGSK